MGTPLLRFHVEAESGPAPVTPKPPPPYRTMQAAEEKEGSTASARVPDSVAVPVASDPGSTQPPASPSVRRLARELGVALEQVVGSGARGRLSKEDVLAFVKTTMERPRQAPLPSTPAKEEPLVDFSLFGPIESLALGRIQKISGRQLARNWATIPHVTCFEEADITDLEAFRRTLNGEGAGKMTILPFLVKAAQCALQGFPQLNASLQGERLIVKKYYHIGFAVDSPVGLLVPVLRDVEKKGIGQLAAEIGELIALAKSGRLKAEQMQGGTFTISSLGAIGTGHFTPIINAPEVAILGVGKGVMRPVWDGGQFLPRLQLPLSLSWDHRVMDGVTAARFSARLVALLADFRRVAL
jgi:pyruvate dehydrogenase E2 component (dihydrolipoamide acetyltransferase)